jgi:diguanylate cyclase (GGDEF)-like protein
LNHDDSKNEAAVPPADEPTRVIARGPIEDAKALRLRGYLTVIRGADHDLGSYVVIDDKVWIGRGGGVDLLLQDDGVSRRHVSIERHEDGGYILFDLDSTNGTYLGPEPVDAPRALRDGDKIFLGTTVLRFALADDIDLGYQTEVAQIVGQDPLTGLESKRRFDDALKYGITTARYRESPLALLMMDMDGVKGINDRYGHLFGAHVIGETGRILARHLGHTGQACRFGGDEFCAFLPGHDTEAACKAAETMRVAVEQAGMHKDGVDLAPTLSIGIAVCPTDATNATELLALADAALYRAKAAGKNRVES